MHPLRRHRTSQRSCRPSSCMRKHDKPTTDQRECVCAKEKVDSPPFVQQQREQEWEHNLATPHGEQVDVGCLKSQTTMIESMRSEASSTYIEKQDLFQNSDNPDKHMKR